VTGNPAAIRARLDEAVAAVMRGAPAAAEAPRALAALIQSGLAQPAADAAARRRHAEDSGTDTAA
jgi:hypothetical protein